MGIMEIALKLLFGFHIAGTGIYGNNGSNIESAVWVLEFTLPQTNMETHIVPF